MVMLPRSCSSGMQSIRRELQRRRPKPLAPNRSATMKQSAPPLPRLQEDPSSAAAKSQPGSADIHAPLPPRPAAISRSTPPPTRSAPSSAGSESPYTLGTDEHLRPCTEVGVRTRTTKLKTGKVLVLWLRAKIVSPTNGGYKVVYDGNWPPGNPYGTVHVARRHVRKIEPSLSPTTRPPRGSQPPYIAPSSSASDTTAVVAAARKEIPPPPRPTMAGKSLRLIRRSLLPEMDEKTHAALPGY